MTALSRNLAENVCAPPPFPARHIEEFDLRTASRYSGRKPFTISTARPPKGAVKIEPPSVI